MTKNILLALAAVATLASCKKDPSIDEQLAGTWTLTDLNMSGSIPSPFGAIPFTMTDSLIRPNNTLELSYVKGGENLLNWNMDVRATFTASVLGSFGIDIQDTISGTWYAVDGRGVTSDSLYIIENGQKTGYEILSRLTNSMTLRSVEQINDEDLGPVTVTQNVTFIK